ncbi:MAG TPA: hypothetical protein H9768_02050 [Candidatus Mailhella merdavium]|nr:hypothetical protein [Candidatus Mailhella merdavium]
MRHIILVLLIGIILALAGCWYGHPGPHSGPGYFRPAPAPGHVRPAPAPQHFRPAPGHYRPAPGAHWR